MEIYSPDQGRPGPEITDFLIEKALRYEDPGFLSDDPIQIPHRFDKKEDIEISGFLVALISWGQRKSILKSGHRMMELMEEAPYDFILNASSKELEALDGFVHRTFNGDDLRQCIRSIGRIYRQYGGLESFFTRYQQPGELQSAISKLKQVFFEENALQRTRKHLADPVQGSAAKRINMYLRWMVRSAERGVDFGIWKGIPSSSLSCPLDVHSGRVARQLGLLHRTQNDARAVKELDLSLRKIDSEDPVRFDFALFGLGVFEKFR
jgi:uncharacterized protein (TIGR02757 family)